MAGGNLGHEVLAVGHERAQRPQAQRYLDCLRGWLEGLSWAYSSCASARSHPALHRAYGAPPAAVSGLEDYKPVTAGLKGIYQSATEVKAQDTLRQFTPTWDSQYSQIAKSRHNNLGNLITLFDYSPEIRWVNYTTNAIEPLISVICKATKRGKLFPTEDSAIKIVYLAVQAALNKRTMP